MTTGDLLLGNRYREALDAEDAAWRARRRRRLKVALLAALFLAVSVAGWRWSGPVSFDTTTLGGGITDPTDGRSLTGPDYRTVVPFRTGARIRIPLILSPDAGGVTITGVRIDTGGGGMARPAGAVTQGPGDCCAITEPVPLRSARPTASAGGVLVGVDVELCCPPPGTGYRQRIDRIRISYRHHGVPYTTTAKLTASQQVVITA